jgi:hypothetical protein
LSRIRDIQSTRSSEFDESEWVILPTQEELILATIKHSDVWVHAEYVLPLNVGSSGYTEYVIDPEKRFALYDVHPHLEDCMLGHIHSHHTMASFFSGTDDDQSYDGALSNAFFLSVIVNNRNEIKSKGSVSLNVKYSFDEHIVADEKAVFQVIGKEYVFGGDVDDFFLEACSSITRGNSQGRWGTKPNEYDWSKKGKEEKEQKAVAYQEEMFPKDVSKNGKVTSDDILELAVDIETSFDLVPIVEKYECDLKYFNKLINDYAGIGDKTLHPDIVALWRRTYVHICTSVAAIHQACLVTEADFDVFARALRSDTFVSAAADALNGIDTMDQILSEYRKYNHDESIYWNGVDAVLYEMTQFAGYILDMTKEEFTANKESFLTIRKLIRDELLDQFFVKA